MQVRAQDYNGRPVEGCVRSESADEGKKQVRFQVRRGIPQRTYEELVRIYSCALRLSSNNFLDHPGLATFYAASLHSDRSWIGTFRDMLILKMGPE